MVLFLRKNVGGVTILLFCTLSGDVLYLYQVLKKISKGFKVIERTLFEIESFKMA